MTWAEACAIAADWPGVEAGAYHGHPAASPAAF